MSDCGLLTSLWQTDELPRLNTAAACELDLFFFCIPVSQVFTSWQLKVMTWPVTTGLIWMLNTHDRVIAVKDDEPMRNDDGLLDTVACRVGTANTISRHRLLAFPVVNPADVIMYTVTTAVYVHDDISWMLTMTTLPCWCRRVVNHIDRRSNFTIHILTTSRQHFIGLKRDEIWFDHRSLKGRHPVDSNHAYTVTLSDSYDTVNSYLSSSPNFPVRYIIKFSFSGGLLPV